VVNDDTEADALESGTELDSPPFRPSELDALAARNWERKYRHFWDGETWQPWIVP
jgi:hypothetical protein